MVVTHGAYSGELFLRTTKSEIRRRGDRPNPYLPFFVPTSMELLPTDDSF